MSIFNFRRGRPASEPASGARAASSAATESVEMVRKRARQRLIGSAVLVLVGVVGFPLLFETQPRPVPVDIAIEIPSRNSVKPGSPIQPVSRQEPAPAEPEPAAKVPAQLQAPAPSASAPAAASTLPPQASLQEREEIIEPPAKPAAAVPAMPPKPPAVEPAKPAPAAMVAKPEPRTQPKADDGQRAKALLEGAATQGTEAQARIVVQVGAFADPAKAREARAKLEKAGLKTYTQMADTKDGTRIRVRLGPYASKAEAEKAAAKVKSLNLPAAVLVL